MENFKIFAVEVTQKVKEATQNIPKNTDLDVRGVLNWVYALAGIVAAGFIVYGGVNYVMAQGDPGKLRQAGQTIAYALIGLAVVLIAAAVTNFVAGAV